MEGMPPVENTEEKEENTFIESYKNGEYAEISPEEIPETVKGELENRVFQYSLDREKRDKPVKWFKVTLDNGDVVYGGQYNEEHGDVSTLDYDKEDKPIWKNIEYAPAFYFFETNKDEEYVGRGSVRFLPGNNEMPIVNYVESEEYGTGRGTARYYLMNQLTESFFDKKLYSSTWTDPKNAPQKIWRRFYEDGEAEIVEEHRIEDEEGNEEVIYRYRFL